MATKKRSEAEVLQHDPEPSAALPPPVHEPGRRGRKIPADHLRKRVEVFEAQEREGFTNQEAAERAEMGLPAWNQWKQKHRRERAEGRAAYSLPPSPRSSGAVHQTKIPPKAKEASEIAEVVRLRSRVAELEALLEGLRSLLDQFVTPSKSA